MLLPKVMHKEPLTSVHVSEWPKPKMRKYYQLTLVVTSVISVILLLIYRHEYNRLRYVLEVLNFFGTPGQSLNGNDCVSPNITHLNYDILGFREHLPAWQRVSSTYSVYSAFWETHGGVNQVKAIGVGLTKFKPAFKCQIWFEDVTDPVPGKFSYLHLDDKNHVNDNWKPSKVDGLFAHFLYCRPPVTLGTPSGVSFYVPAPHVPFKPFIPVESTEDRTIIENNTLLCVAPSVSPTIPKSSVVEFLSYHQLVGINDFIVYDRTLPSQFPVVLQNRVVQERFNIRVLFLPWNFPYPTSENEKAVRLAVEKDCIMRAMGRMRNIVVLSWNEYIVPKYYPSLPITLENFDAGKKSTARFDIPILVFCTDVPDDPQADESLPMAIRKTKCLKGSGLENELLHVYRPLLVAGNRTTGTTQFVSQGIATLHHYAHCFKDNAQISEDNLLHEPSILKYAADLKRSKLLRAGETNKLLQ